MDSHHCIDTEGVGRSLSATKANYAEILVLRRVLSRSQFNAVSAVVEGFNPEKNGTKLQLVPLEAEFFAN